MIWSRSLDFGGSHLHWYVWSNGGPAGYGNSYQLTGAAMIVDYYGIFYILSVMSRSCRLSHPHASSLVWNTGIDLGDNSSETSREYGVVV